MLVIELPVTHQLSHLALTQKKSGGILHTVSDKTVHPICPCVESVGVIVETEGIVTDLIAGNRSLALLVAFALTTLKGWGRC